MKKRYVFLLTLLICMLPFISACQTKAQIVTQQVDGSAMEVHFIDVGQGDSTLIICNGEAMLIDAGDDSKGTAVQLYLKKRNVSELKYVIATHPDSDHIGGLDVILTKFDCDTVIMPELQKDSNAFQDVQTAMQYKNLSNTKPVVGTSYILGDARFTIIAPNRDYGEETNDWSVGLLLSYGQNRFLFTGDAGLEAEKDMMANGMSLQADVYKVAHHGSRHSVSEEWFDAINPDYAVISCGEGNSYGHPHSETLNQLRSRDIQVYRTDEQGSVIAYADGQNITFSCAPSTSWQSGEETIKSAQQQADVLENVTITYVCNTRTMKFHRPECDSVEKMSKKNKKEVTSSREELLNEGYSACKSCNP